MELDKSFFTGVLWQDFQHKNLINLLGKLSTSKSKGNDSTVFDYAVAFLAMYVNDHFDLEEAYMREYRFPDMDDHVAEHKQFVSQIRELRKNHSSYSEDAMNILITNISGWIRSHIMKDDKRLGEFITSMEKEKYSSDTAEKE